MATSFCCRKVAQSVGPATSCPRGFLRCCQSFWSGRPSASAAVLLLVGSSRHVASMASKLPVSSVYPSSRDGHPFSRRFNYKSSSPGLCPWTFALPCLLQGDSGSNESPSSFAVCRWHDGIPRELFWWADLALLWPWQAPWESFLLGSIEQCGL